MYRVIQAASMLESATTPHESDIYHPHFRQEVTQRPCGWIQETRSSVAISLGCKDVCNSPLCSPYWLPTYVTEFGVTSQGECHQSGGMLPVRGNVTSQGECHQSGGMLPVRGNVTSQGECHQSGGMLPVRGNVNSQEECQQSGGMSPVSCLPVFCEFSALGMSLFVSCYQFGFMIMSECQVQRQARYKHE